jgi:Tol biopolymer transport system component
MKTTLSLFAIAVLIGCASHRSGQPTTPSANKNDLITPTSSSSASNAAEANVLPSGSQGQSQESGLWAPNDDRNVADKLLERVRQEGVVRIVSVLASRDKYIFVGEFEISSQDVPAERPMNKNGSETLRAKRRPLHGTDLWLVNKNGTGLQRLTDDGESRDPLLSPSGEEIAFVHSGNVRIIEGDSVGQDDVFYGSVNSRERDAHVEYSQVRFSPNGKGIAALAWDGTTSWVEVTARSNAVSGHVTFAEGVQRYEWNSESELMLDYGRMVLDWDHLGSDTAPVDSAVDASLKTDTDGDRHSPLPRELFKRLMKKLRRYGVMNIGACTISPSGNRIVLEGVFDESPQYAGGPPTKDLWLVKRDGSGLRRLTEDNVSYAPTWSPSGKEIAFTAFGYYSSIGTIDLNKGNVRWLSGLQARHPGAQGTHATWNWGYQRPRWSPNSKVIGAEGQDGETEGWIAAVDTSSGNKLLETTQSGTSFSWNHEGELVIPALGKFVFEWSSALFKRR